MTKWQEAYLRALCTSPEAFLAFKIKQRNKKVLKQFTERLFPVDTEVIDCNKIRKGLLNLLYKLYYNYYSRNGIYAVRTTPGIMLELDKLSSISNFVKRITTTKIGLFTYHRGLIPGRFCNNLFMYFLLNKERCLRLSEDFGFYTDNPGGIGFNNDIITIIFDDTTFKNVVHMIIQILRAIPKNNIYIRRPINIGIEIEHESTDCTSTDIENQILANGCLSYDSGYDGDNIDRLRENRIRLNGINGLKGLYILLEDMRKKCAMTRDSSVHMHIDCRYNEMFFNMQMNINNYTLQHDDISLQEKLLELFDINSSEYPSLIYYMRDGNQRYRLNKEFLTTEYRFCIPSLVYSDYVIQIIALIHITRCIAFNTEINSNLISMLTNIKNKI